MTTSNRWNGRLVSRRLVYATLAAIVFAAASCTLLVYTEMFTYNQKEFCGRKPVYRPCPWNLPRSIP